MQEDISRILNYRADQCLHASSQVKILIDQWETDKRTARVKYKDILHWCKLMELKVNTMQEMLKLLIEVDKGFCDS